MPGPYLPGALPFPWVRPLDACGGPQGGQELPFEAQPGAHLAAGAKQRRPRRGRGEALPGPGRLRGRRPQRVKQEAGARRGASSCGTELARRWARAKGKSRSMASSSRLTWPWTRPGSTSGGTTAAAVTRRTPASSLRASGRRAGPTWRRTAPRPSPSSARRSSPKPWGSAEAGSTQCTARTAWVGVAGPHFGFARGEGLG